MPAPCNVSTNVAMLQRVMARSSPGSAEAAGSRLQRGPPAMQWLYSFIDKTAPRQEVINYERDAAPICSRPPRRGPLSDRFCCKTILGARAGNIDSRTATKAQHRFNKSFAPIRLLRVSRLLPSFATESDPILTWQSEFWTSLFDPIADFIAPS